MTVYSKSYPAPEVNKNEILRYAGVKETSAQISELMEECLTLCLGSFSYNVCYMNLPIKHLDDGLDLGFCVTDSKSLEKNLKGCDSIILFAATVGSGLDRLIARHSVTSPAKAFMLQAIGAERIEALCNTFNAEISQEVKAHCKLTSPRFSAGYGDFPLEFQKNICEALDCQRKIGVTLQESLIMLPTKSVTAIIGIKNQETRDES